MTEALLARHKRVAVVEILHLALLKIVSETNVVMRSEEKAGALAFEPLANRCDFLRGGFLFGKQVIEPEHQESIGVCQNSLINGQFVACLVDSLENGDGMTGDLAGDLLKTEGGAVEQL